MKVILFGSGGQLGSELEKCCPRGVILVPLTSSDADITDSSQTDNIIRKERPRWVVNAAAYTDVDGAENETDRAFEINFQGPFNLASASLKYDIRMAHISTDYVFNGMQRSPYRPDDKPDPKSIYGKSKLKGEQAVLSILNKEALIIRTAWLYSSHGNNFVLTMLKLMKERERLYIVDDQISTPTWARTLSRMLWSALKKDLKGVFHFTDAGTASWYDFAVAIQEEALSAGLLNETIPIMPIPSSRYTRAAQRPAFSLLDKSATWRLTDIKPVHWRRELRRMLAEHAKTSGQLRS